MDAASRQTEKDPKKEEESSSCKGMKGISILTPPSLPSSLASHSRREFWVRRGLGVTEMGSRRESLSGVYKGLLGELIIW